MITKSSLRAFSIYLGLGTLLAASCAREDNGEDPSGGPSMSGSGGSSSKAGMTNKAGTPSGSFGGSSSTTGGKNGTAGSAGSVAAEAGAATGEGGAGGGSSVPPDVLARATAIVYYKTNHTAASDKIIEMFLHIENKSSDPLPMTNVKIRYWFTAEATPELHQYYEGPEAKPAYVTFVDDGANSHALMTFGGGSIVKGGDYNKSEVQLQISNNTTPFDQSDDFSFDETATADKPNGRITLYLDDKLIWGCEPSGACFDDDGAGGAGGTGGVDAGGAGGVDAGGAGASMGGDTSSGGVDAGGADAGGADAGMAGASEASAGGGGAPGSSGATGTGGVI